MEGTTVTGPALDAHKISADPGLSSYTIPQVTAGTSDEYIHKCAEVTARAASADPFTNLLVREKLKSDTVTIQDLYQGNIVRLKTKIAAGAVVVEAASFAAVACWEPPEATEAAYGNVATGFRDQSIPIYANFVERIEACKRRTFAPGTRYWKLSLMGRDPERKDKGAVRAVVERYVAIAKANGHSLWLEAGNPRARDVYGYLGFRVLEEIRSGAGSYDEMGRPAEGGIGVGTWFMVCNWPVDKST